MNGSVHTIAIHEKMLFSSAPIEQTTFTTSHLDSLIAHHFLYSAALQIYDLFSTFLH